MMAQHRKIQIVGNRSYAVSLPKKWVLQNNLHIKKDINIYEYIDRLILTTSATSNPESTKVILNLEREEMIPGILMLCYTKGISQITLNFTKKDQHIKTKKTIWEILSHLEGFKIIEENSERVIIEYFYNNYEINISKIAKRMVSIANQMIECIKLKDIQTKSILENEMDGLYHLSKRILYIASIDPNVKQTNNILDIEEIFLWRLIFKKIENLGDYIERLVFYKINTYTEIEKMLENINEVFISNKTIDITKIESFKNKKFHNEYMEKMKNLIIDILNNYMLIGLNKKIFTNNETNKIIY